MAFQNTERGLRIKGTNFVYHSEGAYGLIFLDKSEIRIRKIYKSTQPLDHRRKVFEAEIKAYEIASKTPELNDFVPQYFGRCTDIILIDKCGKDVTSEIDVTLAFEAEFIEGYFQKCSSFGVNEEKWNKIEEIFFNHGIYHMKDASVTLEADGIKKVIDFSVKEIEPCW